MEETRGVGGEDIITLSLNVLKVLILLEFAIYGEDFCKAILYSCHIKE